MIPAEAALRRREQLARARLYLVCDAVGDDFLAAALRGGVDMVQLRMKLAGDEEILAAARRLRRVCADHGALLILNDRPDLAVRAEADGVHLGQDDASVASARRTVGEDRLVGLSTHSSGDIDRAEGVDYLGVGPVHETPTKPGRPAVGAELVRYGARRARVPFFAIGGISLENVEEIRRAGARRVAVVRALTEASDPGQMAGALRAMILAERPKARVGAA